MNSLAIDYGHSLSRGLCVRTGLDNWMLHDGDAEGSEEIRQRTPLTRSVLLAGPHGVGKSMLVSAACSHVGATLFDMSHSSLLGRYPGKAGMLMLIHLITKVLKLLMVLDIRTSRIVN